MDQLPSYKHKIDFSISNDISVKSKYKKKKCNECNRRRKTIDESHQICHVCYKYKTASKLSGNKVIDDFIRYTQTNYTNNRLNRVGEWSFFPMTNLKM